MGVGGCIGNANQYVNANQHINAKNPGRMALVVELPCDRSCLTFGTRERHGRAFWAVALLA
jgi:hypothetical protein